MVKLLAVGATLGVLLCIWFTFWQNCGLKNCIRIIAKLLAYASAVGSTVSFASDLTAGKNDAEEMDTGGTTLLPQPISHQAASGIMVMKIMLV